ncbi:MAG: putative intracellular protease/amidase [Porticoccaceae bacterium]|jgi:putative intracellular protease/amidase
MSNGKILLVLTSHRELGDSGKITGFYYEEMTDPYYIFEDAGFEVELVSVKGGKPTHDPGSLPTEEKRAASVKRFLSDSDGLNKLAKTAAISATSATGYDGIFLAGGHGAMWDLPENTALARLLEEFHGAGKVISAVCHGPAGLLDAKDETGSLIVSGKRMTGFSNEEEIMTGLDSVVPFMLQDRLSALGEYESGPRFRPYSVIDGKLVTGQNPASSKVTAENVVKVLSGA